MPCRTPFIAKYKGDIEDKFIGVPFDYVKGVVSNDVPVPCGRCIHCKRRKVNDWSFRLVEESRRWSHSHFITLTYDNNHIPLIGRQMTLNKEDLRLYWKRLRRREGTIRYYAVGEYGETNNRPHYHAIVFGISDTDNIYDAWQKGLTHFGEVNQATTKYTAKYIHKKKRIPQYNGDKRVPEFSRMSKNLGDNYLTDEMVKYYLDDIERTTAFDINGKEIPLPRYYRKKIPYTIDQRIQQSDYIRQKINEEEEKMRTKLHKLYKGKYEYEDYLNVEKYSSYKLNNSTNKLRNGN
jgi:hypothetical protein